MRLYHLKKILLLASASCCWLAAAATLSPAPQDQGLIRVEIDSDGVLEAVEVPTGSTVGDALEEAGISLEGKDRSEPASWHYDRRRNPGSW